MINQILLSAEAALADVPNGATVMIGGFGTAGLPDELVAALLAQGARELTVINNNAGNGDGGLAALMAAGRVRKIICSFPRQVDSHHTAARQHCQVGQRFLAQRCHRLLIERLGHAGVE